MIDWVLEELDRQVMTRMTLTQTVEGHLLSIMTEVDDNHMTENDSLMEAEIRLAKAATIITIIAIIAIIVTYHAQPAAISHRMVAMVTMGVVMTMQAIIVLHADIDQIL